MGNVLDDVVRSGQSAWLNRILVSVVALLLTLALSPSAHAQFSGNVQGTISDPTGAVVANAAVTLHNVNTGVDLKQTANSSGFYRFSSIAPGDYTVITTAGGFKSSSIAVTVTTDQTRGVDVALQLGTSNIIMEVSAAAPELNPEETRIESTLPASEVEELPLASHDVQQLIALTPGVSGVLDTNPAAGYGSTLFAGSFTPPYQANGQGSNGNLFLLDDLPVSDDTQQGTAMIFPNADMIREVSLQTQTYSVENGSAASVQVAFTTKSGGNKFHGDLDESYSSSNLGAAQSVINNVSNGVGTPQDVPAAYHQNELLGSVGGPIFKDKTFFFFSFQRQDAGIGQPSPVNENVWDPAFEQWALQAFPNSGIAKAANLAPDTRDVPGSGAGVILASTLYPATSGTPCGTNQTTGSLPYNLPCSTPVYDTGYIFEQSQPFNGTQYFGRLDQNFRNGNDRVYASYEKIHQYLGFLANRPNLDAASPSTTKFASLNWIHVFSPKLLNEVHGGLLRGYSGIGLKDPAIAGSTPWPGPAGGDITNGFSFFQPLGTTVPGGPYTNLEHTYNIRDTVTYTFRNHTVRGGYQWAREDYLTNEQQYARGFPFFGIGDAVAFIANTANYSGAIYSISGTTGEYEPQVYGATVFYNGLWADDTWKVRPNLTITAGLRYDDFGNPVRYSTSSPFAGLFPGAGSTFEQQALNTSTRITPKAFTEAQNMNFQPRFGFAYNPRQGLVLRGGIGLFENALTPAQISINLPTQPPVRVNIGTYGPLDFGDFTTTTPPYGHTYNGQLPFPVYGSNPVGAIYSNPQQTQIYQIQLNGFAPNVKPEKYLNYSFGIEQQLPARMVFSLGYSGSYGYDQLTGAVAQGPNSAQNADYNLAPGSTTYVDPNFAQLRYTRDAGITTNYNAMIVTLKQNYKGFGYQSSYTWSKALQYAPTFNDGNGNGVMAFWPSVTQPKVYYGPSMNDVTNAFSLGGSYEVPKFSGNNRILNEAVSGWRISTITVAQSGTPFSVANQNGPSYATDNSWAIDGNQGGTPAFPTYQGGLPRSFSRRAVSVTGAFTAANFTDPVGAGGTTPVLSQQGANTFRNPGYFNVNAEFAKSFTLPWEGAKLTLRGDFINLLNRTNWQGISQEMASNTFGFSTVANNKRFIQMGARLQF